MKNKIKAGLLAVCMLAAVFAAGCGGSSDTVSMYDLRTAMEAADDTLGEMLSADSNEEDAEDEELEEDLDAMEEEEDD